MVSLTKKSYILVILFLFFGIVNSKYLAEPKKNSIISLFCMENFKEEMLRANLNYDKEIAKYTCACYLNEFSKSASHQKAINKCKLETKKKLNL